MKSIPMLAVFSTTIFCAYANAQSWQEASSDLFTNISIVWRTDTSQLPNSVWIYRRLLPHIFPTAIVSNAVVLGSLQSRGFPQSSTNNVFISSTGAGELARHDCCSVGHPALATPICLIQYLATVLFLKKKSQTRIR
jgi:hypothetical protein